MNDTWAELNWRASFGSNNALTLTCPVNVSAGPCVAGLDSSRETCIPLASAPDGAAFHSPSGTAAASTAATERILLISVPSSCASDDFKRDIEAVGLIFHERQLVTVEAADAYDAVPVADVAVVQDQIL